MKRLLILLLLAAPVHADVRHSIKSSATITLDPAYSSATRIGSTYSVSGSNVTPSKTISGTTTSGAIGGLNIGSVTAGVPAFIDTDFTVTTAGSAFSAVESLTQGDAIQSATIIGAELLGIANKTGTVSIGKEADLIVVTSNPLNDIRTIQDVVFVMSNGKIGLNRLPFEKSN